jgi:hypothetical protein
VLDAGAFRMRVTNAGIVGNAFYGASRSSDPSFEYPAYSGIELLNHAELWVGAIDEEGSPRVSGGPMLEWRPSLAADDRVQIKRRGDLGAQRLFDDDGDGVLDEEILNGRDDDGDGEIDEDLGLFADQDAGAEYTDDRPESVNYGYPTGESHHPLGLSVHQLASAWTMPGYDGVAALTYRITNHGVKILKNVYIGLLADLDSRLREDRPGYRNDRVVYRSYSASKYEGRTVVTQNGIYACGSPPPCPPIQCFTDFGAELPVLVDGPTNSTLPAIAVMPLDHTTDPLTRVDPDFGRAPIDVSFTTSLFSGEGIPGQGGVPTLDTDRYDALAGTYPNNPADRITDWVFLTSCGPFRELLPGQSLEFTVALIAGANADSVAAVMARLALLYHGTRLDTIPNETARVDSVDYDRGRSGISGHEICLEPPQGVTFQLDKDCVTKFAEDARPGPNVMTYTAGRCIWTDLDCDFCTDIQGKETIVRWLDPGQVPPSPEVRVTPGDRTVAVEWDNMPEVLIHGGHVGGPGSEFVAYRVYKLARWRNRESLLPPVANWALLATFSSETSNGELPLDSVLVSTVDYDRILFEQKHYPIGRYRFVDHDVLNGFDYIYVVTTVYDGAYPVPETGGFGIQRMESPLVAKFDDRVTPHTAAVPSASRVTVVPNPYRAHASWDRTTVLGDPLPRHIDFMHLPNAACTIRIYTLAGDFVAQLNHDGSGGNGQAAWNLLSRNGQEVESGIYLFTVDSSLGHEIGKFVVVR